MQDHEQTMPLSALPYFLRISMTFCHAINESIEVYKNDQDQQAFAKILDHLSSDLNYYLHVYQTWEQDPMAQMHKQDLERLYHYLNEAKKLLSSGVALIHH